MVITDSGLLFFGPPCIISLLITATVHKSLSWFFHCILCSLCMHCCFIFSLFHSLF